MTEKNLLIVAITILVIGAGGYGLYNKFSLNLANLEVSPTPSASDILFNAGGSPQIQPSPKKTMKQYQGFKILLPEDLKNKKINMQTSKGEIEFEIYPEATKAASNFIFLANEGFYDGLTFHRVVPGFVIQGGDPTGTGSGGPGYKFEDEPVKRKYEKGIVAMANAGPNTNGSQFFIMLEDNPSLPPNYTIFGKVTSGQEIVDKIQVGDIMTKVSVKSLQ